MTEPDETDHTQTEPPKDTPSEEKDKQEEQGTAKLDYSDLQGPGDHGDFQYKSEAGLTFDQAVYSTYNEDERERDPNTFKFYQVGADGKVGYDDPDRVQGFDKYSVGFVDNKITFGDYTRVHNDATNTDNYYRTDRTYSYQETSDGGFELLENQESLMRDGNGIPIPAQREGEGGINPDWVAAHLAAGHLWDEGSQTWIVGHPDRITEGNDGQQIVLLKDKNGNYLKNNGETFRDGEYYKRSVITPIISFNSYGVMKIDWEISEESRKVHKGAFKRAFESTTSFLFPIDWSDAAEQALVDLGVPQEKIDKFNAGAHDALQMGKRFVADPEGMIISVLIAGVDEAASALLGTPHMDKEDYEMLGLTPPSEWTEDYTIEEMMTDYLVGKLADGAFQAGAAAAKGGARMLKGGLNVVKRHSPKGVQLVVKNAEGKLSHVLTMTPFGTRIEGAGYSRFRRLEEAPDGTYVSKAPETARKTEFDQEMRGVEQEIATLEKQKQEWIDTNESYEFVTDPKVEKAGKDLDDLQDQLADVEYDFPNPSMRERKTKELQAKIEKKQEEMNKLHPQYKDLTDDIDDLQDRLNDLEYDFPNPAMRERKRVELQGQLDAKKAQRGNLYTQVDGLGTQQNVGGGRPWNLGDLTFQGTVAKPDWVDGLTTKKARLEVLKENRRKALIKQNNDHILDPPLKPDGSKMSFQEWVGHQMFAYGKRAIDNIKEDGVTGYGKKYLKGKSGSYALTAFKRRNRNEMRELFGEGDEDGYQVRTYYSSPDDVCQGRSDCDIDVEIYMGEPHWFDKNEDNPIFGTDQSFYFYQDENGKPSYGTGDFDAHAENIIDLGKVPSFVANTPIFEAFMSEIMEGENPYRETSHLIEDLQYVNHYANQELSEGEIKDWEENLLDRGIKPERVERLSKLLIISQQAHDPSSFMEDNAGNAFVFNRPRQFPSREAYEKWQLDNLPAVIKHHQLIIDRIDGLRDSDGKDDGITTVEEQAKFQSLYSLQEIREIRSSLQVYKNDLATIKKDISDRIYYDDLNARIGDMDRARVERHREFVRQMDLTENYQGIDNISGYVYEENPADVKDALRDLEYLAQNNATFDNLMTYIESNIGDPNNDGYAWYLSTIARDHIMNWDNYRVQEIRDETLLTEFDNRNEEIPDPIINRTCDGQLYGDGRCHVAPQKEENFNNLHTTHLFHNF